MSKPVAIARDPFARATLYRMRVEPGSKCAWCGGRGRFVYWWEKETMFSNPPWRDPLVTFCGIEDWRAYYGFTKGRT